MQQKAADRTQQPRRVHGGAGGDPYGRGQDGIGTQQWVMFTPAQLSGELMQNRVKGSIRGQAEDAGDQIGEFFVVECPGALPQRVRSLGQDGGRSGAVILKLFHGQSVVAG